MMVSDVENILRGETEHLPPVSSRTIGIGTDRARGYMEHLIKNEKIHREKKVFGVGLLSELHKRILFYFPNWAGKYRIDDDVRIGGRRVALASEIDERVHLFESWLEKEVDKLKRYPEDLYDALRVAAAAHYGIVSELHPFNDGNGRLARVVMNGILMLNTREGLFHNLYILPIPILREHIDIKNILRQIEISDEAKLSTYIQAIEDVNNSQTLNPFEVYIANAWAKNIGNFLNELKSKYKKSKGDNWEQSLNESERKLIEKIKERRRRLFQFIEDNRQGRYVKDPVPAYSPFQHWHAKL